MVWIITKIVLFFHYNEDTVVYGQHALWLKGFVTHALKPALYAPLLDSTSVIISSYSLADAHSYFVSHEVMKWLTSSGSAPGLILTELLGCISAAEG